MTSGVFQSAPTQASTAGAANLAGTPVLNLTNVPQQVPVGNGCTLVNPGSSTIILSTDAIPSSSNSFPLPPNGASLPITSGPLWASVASGTATMLVIPQVLNIFNPNVLSQIPPPGELTSGNLAATPGPGTTFQVPITSPNIRTLIFELSWAPTTSYPTLIVVGNQSGIVYNSGQPYLPGFMVVPIVGILDTSITVTVINVTGTTTYAVYGDNQIYDQDLFYDDLTVTPINASPVNTSQVLVQGPSRVLSLNLYSQNGAVVQAFWGATEICRCASTNSASAVDGTTIPMTFPNRGIILPHGTNLIIATSGVGGAAFGYGAALYCQP